MLNKIQQILEQEGFYGLLQRVLLKLMRESSSLYDEAFARWNGSYSIYKSSHSTRLIPRLESATCSSFTIDHCIPEQVSEHYLDHRFDLLGSGWVKVYYNMQCRGLLGHSYKMGEAIALDVHGNWLKNRLNSSNIATAMEIWKRIDSDYQPIDWQLDFKSGYRWCEKTWSTRLRYGHLLGVDVKLPWELARMQHLPQMAIRAGALGVNCLKAKRLVRDIRNQWLDFIATNPPGFGVNWICPMDVAIRGANWCLAWDILHASGFALDLEDENILLKSLYDHAKYIVKHLEWSRDRANHYLADICGLTFIAVYLPESIETDNWLAFTIGQLKLETLRQFLPDGGNFEGSTAYHRLSNEMVIYTTALILGLPQDRLTRLSNIDPKRYDYLPGEAGVQKCWELYETDINEYGQKILTPFELGFVEQLQKAIMFFAAILKADGTFPQIGDNDSGRFFKPSPLYSVFTVHEVTQRVLSMEHYSELSKNEDYYFESHCNGDHLVAAGAAIGFCQSQVRKFSGVEFNLIESIAGKRKFLPLAAPHKYNTTQKGDIHALHYLSDRIYKHPNGKKRIFSLPSPNETLLYKNFQHFGLHVWSSDHLVITVRSIEYNIAGAKCHFHDDQLGVEITLNGITLIRDPGTYVYTPLPTERNRYRSRRSHFPSSETRNVELPTFDTLRLLPVKASYSGMSGFAGYYQEGENMDSLVLHIEETYIYLYTLSEVEKQSVQNTQLNLLETVIPPYSPGYGIQERVS